MATNRSQEADDKKWQKKVQELTQAGHELLGMALGNDLGLFKAMGELDKPVTAAELAEKTDCKERYVREWLLLMTMKGTLNMDESSTKFSVPDGSLEGLMKLGQAAVFFTSIAPAHEPLVEAFKTSGPRGIQREASRLFRNFREQIQLPMWKELCPGIADVVAGLRLKLDTGADVAEIGCYTGDFCLAMAPHFPRSTFYGVDVNRSSILTAREAASSRGIRNIRFEIEDAAYLPENWADKFDAIYVFNTFHDIPQASRACEEMKKALKPGGYCLISDIDMPSNPAEQKRDSPEYATEIYVASMYQCLPLCMNEENSEALGAAAGLQRITAMFEETGLRLVPKTELSLPEGQEHLLVFVKL